MELKSQPPLRFAFGDFVLDVSEAALMRRDTRVQLAPKEFELLRILVSQGGHLVTKEALIHDVWPDTFVSDSSLLRTVSAVRRHVGHDAIRNVPKRGYVFSLPVVILDSPTKILSRSSYAQPDCPPPNQDENDCRPPDYLPDASPALMSIVMQRGIRPVAAFATIMLFSLAVLFVRWPRVHVAQASDLKVLNNEPTPRAAGAVRLFILNQNEDSISVLNTLKSIVRTKFSVNSDPRGAAVLPSGKAIYISLNGANTVVALDTRTRKIIATIPVGDGPVGIVANPRPPFVYVANNYSDTISVIDARSNRVVRTLAAGSLPTEIAITPDGTRAVVTNQAGGTVTMVDTVANRILSAIPVGSTPVGVAFTPDSKFAWVTLAGQDEVAVLDLANQSVAHYISAGHGPVRVVITRDGRYALVSNFFSNTVTIIDAASFRTTETIKVGLNPVGISLDSPGDFAYVANYGSNTISVINIKAMRVVNNFEVGKNPVEMAALPCYTIECESPQAQINSNARGLLYR